MIRWRAKNPSGTAAYFQEPYTVQHFTDMLKDRMHLWAIEVPQMVWEMFRYYTSKKVRLDYARAYNQSMFGSIPTSQIYVQDDGRMRPLREEERTWPE